MITFNLLMYLQWNKLFPIVYDNKVFAHFAQYFGKSDLASVFSKVQNDQRMKNTCLIAFDKKNGFAKYEGSTIDS